MIQKVRQYCVQNNMLSQDDRIVIGLSGGADSVCLFSVLLELKQEYNLTLTAVHINHMLRGEESDLDQEYAETLCKDNQIPCYCYRKDIQAMAKREQISFEEAGREYRYQVFKDVMESEKAQKIAVAHHNDDQAETVLFHMVRGSGLKGLAGMAPVRGAIIRPLLDCSKSEILSYLCEKHIAFREDLSNQDTLYTRNKIRIVCMPMLKEINSKAAEHIGQSAKAVRESLDYITQEVDAFYNTQVRKEENKRSIDVEVFMQKHLVIQKGVIKKMMTELSQMEKDILSVHIEDVLNLLENQVSKKVDLPYGLEAVRQYERIVIRKKMLISEKNKVFDYILDGEGDYKVEEAHGIFSVNIVPYEKNEIIPKKKYTKAFDYDKIKGNLHIRGRKPGDRIVVSDDSASKTLKKYMIDEKIPKDVRDCIPVLAEGSKILWILGYRIGADYKVDDTTKRVLLIEYRLDKKEK